MRFLGRKWQKKNKAIDKLLYPLGFAPALGTSLSVHAGGPVLDCCRPNLTRNDCQFYSDLPMIETV
jgi:hypothetical protein